MAALRATALSLVLLCMVSRIPGIGGWLDAPKARGSAARWGVEGRRLAQQEGTELPDISFELGALPRPEFPHRYPPSTSSEAPI